jgi:hypothetical protein
MRTKSEQNRKGYTEMLSKEEIKRLKNNDDKIFKKIKLTTNAPCDKVEESKTKEIKNELSACHSKHRNKQLLFWC